MIQGLPYGPTIGVDPRLMNQPPPALKAMLARTGLTAEQMLQDRRDFVGRLHQAGVRLVSGVDSGIGPAKQHGTLPHAVAELITAGLSAAEAVATANSKPTSPRCTGRMPYCCRASLSLLGKVTTGSRRASHTIHCSPRSSARPRTQRGT
jgi:hypothetical protein